MRLLAVDTASRQCSVAVYDSNADLLQQRGREVTTHSEGLLALIDETLRAAQMTASDLDAIVCGRGPGSFTGLRIGMATVKGLCLAADKPLICVPSMVGIAGAVADRVGAGQLVAVLLDARRDELFCGFFRAGKLVGEEVVLSPAAARELVARERPDVIAGDGALRYQQDYFATFTLADEDCHAIQAGYLCRSALERAETGQFDDLTTAVPHYIRPPDVRLPKHPQDRTAASAPEGDSLLEQLRDSGLRLDRDGCWWHEGTLVEHERLNRALHRWLDRLEDGRFIVRVDPQRFVYVEVEDAPYLVRFVEHETAEAGLLRLRLSDDSEELLDPLTLTASADGVLYCRVKQGRYDARFSRNAQASMADLIETIGDDEENFALRVGDELVPIRPHNSRQAD